MDNSKVGTVLIGVVFLIGGVISLLLVMYLIKGEPPLVAAELCKYGAIVLVTVALLGAMLLYACTKKNGFGPYNTSTLILILAIPISAALAIVGKLDGPAAQILIVAIGFAGGIFAGEKKSRESP